MTEKAFVAKAKKRLETEVGGVWVTFPRTRFARAGVSDLLGCVLGSFIAVEFKRPGGSYGATQTQTEFLHRVHANGGYSRIVDSPESLDDFIVFLLSGVRSLGAASSQWGH